MYADEATNSVHRNLPDTPASFLPTVESQLADISANLARLANRLYEAGFPAGPQSVGSAGKPCEDNYRSRVMQRLDELQDIVRALTDQIERIA